MTGVHFSDQQRWVLLITAAVSSASGLAVELLLGTLTSYLVGNQALSYGVAVGGFLAAMGLGSYLSQFIAVESSSPNLDRVLMTRFIQVELLIAPLTALLPLGLFALFTWDYSLWLGLILSTLILGTLAGMEVPLLTRMLERDEGLRGAIAQVLALDYVGALVGSLLFPLLLLPLVGLLPAAAIIGSFPAVMVAIIGWLFPKRRQVRRWGIAAAIVLWGLAFLVTPVSNRLEDNLYSAPIVRRVQSAYQRIVITRQAKDLRLYLDGDLQFSTLDEYRYHEPLVHPAMAAATPRRVLLLGAGDGLALREALKWPQVESITLVELDPAMVDLATQYAPLREIGERSLDNPKVNVVIGDAFSMLGRITEQFDVIIADFPDPDQEALAKLYSKGFYHRVRDRLAPDGVFVTQASSPFFAPKVMACIDATLRAESFQTYPYIASVPSFGIWGFVLATHGPIRTERFDLPVETRYLTVQRLRELFSLPADVTLGDVEVNRLTRPVILQYQNSARWLNDY
ncbi:MAG: polyamine aminopropyltransferase [Cyanobacteria bacterium P01_F01_bin.42]